MSIDKNDPRLTAYALGELDDNERRAIESELKNSPEARQAVTEISKTADALTVELQAEPVPGLSDSQRQGIQSAADSTPHGSAPPIGKSIPKVAKLRWSVLRIAAAIVIVAGVGWTVFAPSLSTSRDSAKSLRLAARKESRESEAPRGMSAPSGAASAGDEYRKQLNQLGYVESSTSSGTTSQSALENSKKPATGKPSAGSIAGARFQVDWYDSVDPTSLSTVRRRGGRGGGQGGIPGSIPPEMARRLESLEYVGETDGFNVFAFTNKFTNNPSTGPSFGLEVPSGPRGEDGKNTFLFGLPGGVGSESYDQIVENPFRLVSQNPLSTFSIDVDTASYSNVRRHLHFDQWPPAGAVRIEEMVNYFDYDYPQPEGEDPFGVDIVVASCPWREEHRLVRVGLKGYELEANERPMANLVFLLDVSGSMNNPYKLPLVKESMRMLVENLSGDDYVAIVVYAGAAGEVLPSTSAANQGEILGALDDLQAGGSTNAGDGIQLAYQIADDNFIEGGINRVILATDGDFNVGITDRGALDRLITVEAKKGVFLTVLGFGMGNLKDSTMESLADKGNGNYAYIDSSNEAHKVLVEQLSGTLVTIAKDVKIQIEFNPAQVTAYRLIGYENRILAARDFNDDRKDAGEIGAGHTVTALYEVVPVGVELDAPSIDPLKYQPVAEDDSEAESDDDGEAAVDEYDEDESSDASESMPAAEFSHELLTLKLRYKQPDGDTSTLMEYPVIDDGGRYVDADADFQFAAAVASFGMLLRDSSYKGDATFDSVYEMAEAGLGEDYYGYRAEFLELIDKAAELAPSGLP